MKEDAITTNGTVVDVLPNTLFRVQLDDIDKIVIGHLSGRMRKNNIKVLLGDKVEIEFSPYDFAKGRIIRRN